MALISLHADLPPLLIPGTVVRREDQGVFTTATELLEAVDRHCRDVRASLDQEVAAAREEGFRKGLEEGRSKASELHAQTLRDTASYLTSIQESLVEVMIGCVRNLILELPARERMSQLVGRALKDLNGAQKLTLSVAPAASIIAGQVITDLQQRYPELTMEVKVRPDLADDACTLESPLGVVDASLESQLAAIRSGLDGRRENGSSPAS